MIKKLSKSWIYVTFDREIIMKHEEALQERSLATGDWNDVSFLGFPHRCLVTFTIWLENIINEEVNDIQFKRWLDNRLYDWGELAEEEEIRILRNKTLQQISDDLSVAINRRYPNRKIIIDLSKNKEMGIRNHYLPLA